MTTQSAPAVVYNMPGPDQVGLTPMTIMYPADHSSSNKPSLINMRRTAIIQIIAGVLLVCFGIVAIILLGFWSYYATSIWIGLVIFVLNGCIGLKAASSGSRCLISTYITMSVVAILASLALSEMYIWAAVLETGDWYDYHGYTWICQPGNEHTVEYNCAKSEAARQTFDALIAATGLFLFVHCIVSASIGCCASCACCRMCCSGGCCSGCSSCCKPVPPPATAVFTGSNGTVLTQGHVMPQGQPGMFVIQQNPTVAYPPPAGAYPGQLQPAMYIAPNQQAPMHQPQSSAPQNFYAGAPHQQPPTYPTALAHQEPVNEKSDLP